MKRDDISAKSDCAARKGGAFAADLGLRVAMLSNPDAMIRTLGVSA